MISLAALSRHRHRQPDAVLASHGLQVEFGALHSRGAQEVIEARRSESATPSGDGRLGRVRHFRHASSAAQFIDQSVSKRMHAANVTNIETSPQAKTFDHRNCANRHGHDGSDMDIATIVRQLKERGVRNVDLANALGITPQKVSLSLSGGRRWTAEEALVLKTMLGEAAPELGQPVRKIPVIGQVTAGAWREQVASGTATMPAPDAHLPPNAIALDVEGDSMNMYVQDGGRIIFDPDDRALYPRRFYVVLNGAGETTFKRFFADPARLEPCSTNPDHRSIVLGDGETFTIVGRVIWQASRMPD